MSDLLELAERCEAAEGPDRALDCWIMGKVSDPSWTDADCEYAAHNPGVTLGPPAYTASLDAAMMLVPEGWGWLVSQPNAKALASGLLKERTPVMGEVQYGIDHRHTVAAATPALALCAASLRARAHLPAASQSAPQAVGSTLHGIEAAGGDVGGAG